MSYFDGRRVHFMIYMYLLYWFYIICVDWTSANLLARFSQSHEQTLFQSY